MRDSRRGEAVRHRRAGRGGLAVLAVVAAASLPAPPAPAQTLELRYEGVFGPPRHAFTAPRFGYGLRGLSYSPDCAGRPDPSPDDGYPGCLLGTSHTHFDSAGVFDIPAPQQVPSEQRKRDFWHGQLRRAVTVVDFFDPSGGLKQRIERQPGWQARDIPGVLLLGDELLSICGHDWYNAGRVDHDSHCWARLRPDGSVVDAIGPFNFGSGRRGRGPIHADMISHYIGLVGQRFADAHLDARGKQLCFSGMQREGGGAPGHSQGPTLFVHSCARPEADPPGPLTATPLLYYRTRFPISIEGSDFPEFSPKNECVDAVWVERPEGGGVIFACRQTGPYWWYGTADPWREPENGPLINHRNLCFWNKGDPRREGGGGCAKEFSSYGPPLPCYERDEAGNCVRGLTNRCGGGKGFQAVYENDPQIRARLLWYPEAGLAEVARGAKEPWQAPFEVALDHPSELWPGCRGSFGGVALDPKLGKLYVAQIERQELPVIHVYSVEVASAAPAGPPKTR